MFRRKHVRETALERVGILIFVDVDVLPTILHERANVVMFFKQSHRQSDEVVKVECLLCHKCLFISLPRFRDDSVTETRVNILFVEFLRAHPFPLMARNLTEHRAWRELLRLDIKRLERRGDRLFRIIAVVDAEKSGNSNDFPIPLE